MGWIETKHCATAVFFKLASERHLTVQFCEAISLLHVPGGHLLFTARRRGQLSQLQSTVAIKHEHKIPKVKLERKLPNFH
jgi:hypothetical protein